MTNIDCIEQINEIGEDLISKGYQHNFAGLITNWYELGKYDSTPLNTVLFAFTGSNGVHFSYLEIDKDISPIIMTVPANWGNTPYAYNVILALNMDEFLGLGYCNGWFSLENYVYDSERTLIDYSSSQEMVEFGNPSERLFLNEIVSKFQIKPFFLDENNLHYYKDKYFGLLEFDDNFMKSIS